VNNDLAGIRKTALFSEFDEVIREPVWYLRPGGISRIQDRGTDEHAGSASATCTQAALPGQAGAGPQAVQDDGEVRRQPKKAGKHKRKEGKKRRRRSSGSSEAELLELRRQRQERERQERARATSLLGPCAGLRPG